MVFCRFCRLYRKPEKTLRKLAKNHYQEWFFAGFPEHFGWFSAGFAGFTENQRKVSEN